MATIELERPVEALPELDEAGQVLRRAAESLRRNGWLQGDEGRPGRPRCPLGALSGASRTKDELIAGAKMFTSALGLEWTHALGLNIAAWNDVPGRTAEEVIEAMERAAYWL